MSKTEELARRTMDRSVHVPKPIAGGLHASAKNINVLQNQQVQQLAKLGSDLTAKKLKDYADTAYHDAATKAIATKSTIELEKQRESIKDDDPFAVFGMFGATPSDRGLAAGQSVLIADERLRKQNDDILKGAHDGLDEQGYIQMQSDSLQATLATLPDNFPSEARLSMVQSITETDMKVTANFSKRKAELRQKEALSTYAKTVSSATDTLAEGIRNNDQIMINSATASLEARLERPEGMYDDSYMNTLVAEVENAYASNVPQVHEIINKKNLQFSPEQQDAMADAERQFTKRKAQQGSIQQAKDFADISMIAEKGSMRQMEVAVAKYNQMYPDNPMSMLQMSSMYKSHYTAKAKGVSAANNLQAGREGNYHYMSEKEAKKVGSALIKEKMEAGDFIGAADEWVKIPVKTDFDTQLSTAMSPNLAVDGDGAATELGVNTYQTLKALSMRDKANKLSRHMDQESYRMFQAVQSLEEFMPVETAIEKVSQGIQNPVEVSDDMKTDAKKYFDKSSFQHERPGDWWKPWQGLDDSAVMQMSAIAQKEYNFLRQYMSDSAAIKTAEKIAGSQFIRTDDGKVIPTTGQDITAQVGTNDPNEVYTLLNNAFTNDKMVEYMWGVKSLGDGEVTNMRVSTAPNGTDIVVADLIDPTGKLLTTRSIALDQVGRISEETTPEGTAKAEKKRISTEEVLETKLKGSVQQFKRENNREPLEMEYNKMYNDIGEETFNEEGVSHLFKPKYVSKHFQK